MILQYAITGIIIAFAAGITTRRVIKFFSKPGSKCDGCSGCQLKEMKSIS
jgi:hypothetical protein